MYRKNRYIGLVGDDFLRGISIEIYDTGTKDTYRLVAAREDGQAIERLDKKGYAEAFITKDEYKIKIKDKNKENEIVKAMQYVGL